MYACGPRGFSVWVAIFDGLGLECQYLSSIDEYDDCLLSFGAFPWLTAMESMVKWD